LDRVRNFLDTDPGLWDRIIAINLYGPLHMHHIVLRAWWRADSARGHIASDAGRVDPRVRRLFGVQGGIIALPKRCAGVGAQGHHTERAVPGRPIRRCSTRCSMHAGSGKIGEAMARAIPLKRIGKPDDYPGTIAFLLSDDARISPGRCSACPVA